MWKHRRGRCDTCQHWQPKTGPDATSLNELLPFDLRRGECALIVSTDNPRALAVVEHDGHRLTTLASFGCVQWEAP